MTSTCRVKLCVLTGLKRVGYSGLLLRHPSVADEYYCISCYDAYHLLPVFNRAELARIYADYPTIRFPDCPFCANSSEYADIPVVRTGKWAFADRSYFVKNPTSEVLR